MIYVAIASAIVFLILWRTGPERIEVSAHGPKNWIGRYGRTLMSQMFTAPTGKRIGLGRNKIVATVNGHSAVHLGVHDGSTVIAEKIKDPMSYDFKVGDLVIINSPTDNGDNPFRLREIEAVYKKTVKCVNPPNSEWDELKTRGKDVIYGIVTHIEVAEIEAAEPEKQAA